VNEADIAATRRTLLTMIENLARETADMPLADGAKVRPLPAGAAVRSGGAR
jgi:hypothetical protein